jgi:hypothetical protein
MVAFSWDVERVVNSMALQLVKQFYPTSVAKETGLPLEDTFSSLIDLVKQNKLILKWEIRCPAHCARTIITLEKLPENLSCLSCTCGEDYEEITSDMIYPVFEISAQYKAYLRDQNCKKKHSKRMGTLLPI